MEQEYQQVHNMELDMEQGLGYKLVVKELVRVQVPFDRQVLALDTELEQVDQLERILSLELDKVEVQDDRLGKELELVVE